MKIIKIALPVKEQLISDLFLIKAGGDVSKLEWQNKKDNIYKYPIYSNYISNKGIYGYCDKFQENGEFLTITARGTIGKVFYRNEKFTPIGRLLFLKSRFDYLNVKYFSYLLDYIKIRGESGVIQSLTIPMISSQKIKYIESKEQQNKISNILSLQEEQIENIKQLIKKIEIRNQYYAEKILSGELRVRKDENGNIEFYNNTEWQEDSLKSLFFSKEYSVPKGWKIKSILDNIRLIKGTSINSSKFNYQGMGRQFLRTGDVWEDSSSKKEPAFFDGVVDDKFIKTENDYISCFEGFNKEIGNGTIGLVTNLGEGIISSHLYKTENKNIDGKYYSVALLKTDYIQNILIRNAVGSTVLSSTKCLKDILFIFPDNDEMMLIEDILSSLYSESNNLRKILEKEQLRFQWLLDNLLSGEYQVVDE
ncbi:restriction endonuclease subunit S [Shigella flexneri]